MKIMCFKTTQAKIEILIDENVTMTHLKYIFNRVKESKMPSLALEALIMTDGKTTVWDNYLYAVRSFILGNTVDKNRLIPIFVALIRKKIFEWIRSKNTGEANYFFSRSNFCINLLCKKDNNIHLMNGMSTSENYSYRIGMIAGEYIKFKREVKEESNSLTDILTYSKYDREKLRFVYQRISLGTSLSKANQQRKDKMTKLIGTIPNDEIPESESSKDYSYFFYKGAFETMGGNSNGK